MNDFYCDEILTGKTKVKIITETDNVLAFYHTKPSYKIHIVIIPKRHIASLIGLEDKNLLQEIFKIIKQVAKDVVNQHGGCKVVTNLGSYQDSKHLHWHVYYED